jgi:hypothetical protein
MKQCTIMICGALLLASSLSLAAGPVEEQLKRIEQRAAKAAASTVGEYAKDGLDAVGTNIAAAKAALAAGRDSEAQQQTEMAEARLNAAEARAAEKEIAEKVAVRRAELKKSEALLERYRQGEVN